MLRAWSGFLAVALLGAMAMPASAQSLDGDWVINIPQEPYGPALWELEEEAGAVTGTTEITDSQGVDITGELTGTRIFPFFYLLYSEFETDAGIGGVPTSNVAIVWVFMGKLQGHAISAGGVHFDIYHVTGQRELLGYKF